MAAAIRIETGWPAPILSPNARPHRLTLYKAQRNAKNEAFAAAYQIGRRDWAKQSERFNVTIHAEPGCRRNRDNDNLIASVKAHLDGIARALDVDDSRFNAPDVVWHSVRKGAGRLTFQIEPAPC